MILTFWLSDFHIYILEMLSNLKILKLNDDKEGMNSLEWMIHQVVKSRSDWSWLDLDHDQHNGKSLSKYLGLEFWNMCSSWPFHYQNLELLTRINLSIKWQGLPENMHFAICFLNIYFGTHLNWKNLIIPYPSGVAQIISIVASLVCNLISWQL